MLGVHRSKGFDYGATSDGADAGDVVGTVDDFRERRKRFRSSVQTLCVLNTHCMDVPELLTSTQAPEVGSGGIGVVDADVDDFRFLDEARLIVGCRGKAVVRKEDIPQRKPKKKVSAKRLDNVPLRCSPRLAKISTNVVVSASPVSPFQRPDEVTKAPCLVTGKVGGNSDLEGLELFKCPRKEEGNEDSSVSHVLHCSQVQDDTLLESMTREGKGNVPLNNLPEPIEDSNSGTSVSPYSLPNDVSEYRYVRCEFLESQPSDMTKAPRSIYNAETSFFTGEDRLMDEHNGVPRAQTIQPADLVQEGNELTIVLGLPCFPENTRTRERSSMKMAHGRKKSVSKASWRSLGFRKDEVHGDILDSSELSDLSEIRGLCSIQDISGNRTGKETSPTNGIKEVTKCHTKLQDAPTSGEVHGNMSAGFGCLVSCDTEHQGQSGNSDNGCEPSGELLKPLFFAKTPLVNNYTTEKSIQKEGMQDINGVYKEKIQSVNFSTIKDPRKKEEAQHKEIVTRKMVKETLRLFQAICRKLLREEESKARKPCHNNRVDIMALNLIKDKRKCLNVSEHLFGSIPGVEIGDEFRYRAELSVIGLHRNILAGVSYAKHDGVYIASSIVFYEGYFDLMGRSDILLYSGSTGYPKHNSHNNNKNGKHCKEQKLDNGNLALRNSMDVQIPIRVILGLKESKATNCRAIKAKGSAIYVYDGLYLVEKCLPEIGNNGFLVLKFQLRRIPGQKQLAIKEIQISKGYVVNSGLCVHDISQGKEKIPVHVVNSIDNECPLHFNYINKIMYSSWHKLIPPSGCDCINGCMDSMNCACAVKNGGEIPFNFDGAIVEAKPLVYECGPYCKCPPSCHNRVSQHGIKYPLEVFKTKSMGWGIRSLTSIPSGSFICEYTGEMIEESEANKRTNDDYLFDIGQNYYDKALWEGLSTYIPSLQQDSSCEIMDDEVFTIDAANYGNIGRFINHCCSPNLYAQNILYDHDDKRMPHIMFFAAENISPLEELTYHYNYTIDQVHDSDGNVKKKVCHCGAAECTGWLY